jgi:GT2 family glycosyltransferase
VGVNVIVNPDRPIMSTHPTISIIMVSYFTGPVLERSIAAVLAQTVPCELVLVDNGNPPEVTEQLKHQSLADHRLTFLTGHGNVGFSKGCNLGAKAARGEYLLFLNPDSLLPDGALERLLVHAAALPRPCLIGARLLDGQGRDQRGCRRALLTPKTALIEALHLHRLFPRERLNYHEEPVPERLTPIPAISGAFMFLAAADFWRINGFDEGYFLHVEDLDLCWRFRQAGGKIYFAPDIVVTHIGGTSKATSAFIEKHKAAGFKRYFKMNFKDSFSKLLFLFIAVAIDIRAYIIVLKKGS